MKYYNLVIKSSCPFCQEAISMLKERGEQYIYTDMENCEWALDIIKVSLEHKTVPMIWEVSISAIDAVPRKLPPCLFKKFIGGCDDLKEYLAQQN
jgi:glutaredoxin